MSKKEINSGLSQLEESYANENEPTEHRETVKSLEEAYDYGYAQGSNFGYDEGYANGFAEAFDKGYKKGVIACIESKENPYFYEEDLGDACDCCLEDDPFDEKYFSEKAHGPAMAYNPGDEDEQYGRSAFSVHTELIDSIENLSNEITKIERKYCAGKNSYENGLVGNKLMSLKYELQKIQEEITKSQLYNYLREKRKINAF